LQGPADRGTAESRASRVELERACCTNQSSEKGEAIADKARTRNLVSADLIEGQNGLNVAVGIAQLSLKFDKKKPPKQKG